MTNICQRVFLASLMLLLAAHVLSGEDKTVYGVLTDIRGGKVIVKDGKTSTTVRLTLDTVYREWIIGKLTQRQRSARFEDLKVGSHVRIVTTGSNPPIAVQVEVIHSFFAERLR